MIGRYVLSIMFLTDSLSTILILSFKFYMTMYCLHHTALVNVLSSLLKILKLPVSDWSLACFLDDKISFPPSICMKLEVQCPPGNPIGSVTQELHPFLPKFMIRNERDEPVLKLTGPFCICGCDTDFEVCLLKKVIALLLWLNKSIVALAA